MWTCGKLALTLLLLAAAAPRGAFSQQAQEDNSTLAVCPSALWKKLIFLKGPASLSTFDNVTHWKQGQVQEYAKKTVIPQIQANIIFFFVALVYVIGFMLWRLVRCCCVACCMRESCAEQRAAADPKAILSGCRFWLLKIFLMLASAAAVAIMVAGIVIAQKELVGKLWPPLHRFNSHLTTMADDMDALMRSLDGVNPIVNNLTSIANNDVNFPAIRTSMQSIITFLDLPAADPSPIESALSALSTGVASAQSQLTAWESQLSALQPNASSLAANISSLSTAVSTFNTYSTRLSTLSSELTTLTSAAFPSYSSANLGTAMAAVDLPTWQSNVNSMVAALDAWRGLQASTAAGTLSSAATALDTAVTSLKNVQLSSAASAVNAFFNAWNIYGSAFGSLLARVDSIQATVVVLDAGTNSALQPLRTLYANMTAFQSQGMAPSALASNLSTLISELNLGPTSALVTSLSTAVNAVPPSVLDGARTSVASVKTALDALRSKKDATAAALTTFNNSPSQVNLDALKATASGAGNTGPLTSTAQTAAAAAAADANVAAVQTAITSGGLVAVAANINSNLVSASSSAATVGNRLAARVPPLGPYVALASAARAAFAGLPSPKSSALAAVQATVNDVENQIVNVPANVQYQVVNAQRSFQDGVNKLRSQVIDKVNKFEADKKRPLERVDTARYRATCVVFALAGFFALLLLVCVAINCPFGVAASILAMLLMSALLFLLSVLFASGLVVAQDGCYNAENIAINSVGSSSSVQPLLEYYFFGSANSSVRAALREANLVDVDKVEGQITGQARNVIANITADYTPRPKLQAVLDNTQAFINSTLSQIDGVLLLAGVGKVRPLYEDLKSFPCCDVATYGAKSYLLLTLGGWILMFAANLAMGFLGKLDQLPHAGCCGCKPLLLSRIQKQVHPDGSAGKGDEEAAPKAVVLSPPGQQAMVGKPGAGGVEPAADALPSAPPLPYGTPYALGPGGAYAAYPPLMQAQPGMLPYAGAQPPPVGVPPAQQHYVGAFVGAPMVPQGGVPVDPFTGMPMVAPPPAPVAPPPAGYTTTAAQSQFPPIGPPGAH